MTLKCGLMTADIRESPNAFVFATLKNHEITCWYLVKRGRRGDLIVTVLLFGSCGLGWNSGRGHCVVFLGERLSFDGSSLHPGV